MPKSERQKDREQLQRDKNLIAFRAEMRERDSFCGDGIAGGRYFSSHGFHRKPEIIGPVARSDLKQGPQSGKETGK